MDDLVVRLTAELAEARYKERADIARATADKRPLGEHHWQNRWSLEQRLRAAKLLQECFT